MERTIREFPRLWRSASSAIIAMVMPTCYNEMSNGFAPTFSWYGSFRTHGNFTLDSRGGAR